MCPRTGSCVGAGNVAVVVAAVAGGCRAGGGSADGRRGSGRAVGVGDVETTAATIKLRAPGDPPLHDVLRPWWPAHQSGLGSLLLPSKHTKWAVKQGRRYKGGKRRGDETTKLVQKVASLAAAIRAIRIHASLAGSQSLLATG